MLLLLLQLDLLFLMRGKIFYELGSFFLHDLLKGAHQCGCVQPGRDGNTYVVLGCTIFILFLESLAFREVIFILLDLLDKLLLQLRLQ